MPRPRSSEWLIIAYFTYVAVVGVFFHLGVQPWLMLGVVLAVVLLLSFKKSVLRDFAPALCTLAAYREMNWFTRAFTDHHLENTWIIWDRQLLDSRHFRAAIESLGVVFPTYFELCYLLVYAVAPVSIGLLFSTRHRERVNRFWVAYLAGTLGAYALFPYFPSNPPWVVFPGADLPHVLTAIRRFNLWILGGYGIHSSVFPSAHVSSALSAGWGLLATIPERPWIGRVMMFYGISVAIATIYGRYHYGVDALAGIGISFLAIAAIRLQSRYID